MIDVAGQVRYRLHDLTRLFAREQLDAEAVREALSDLVTVAMARVQASRFTLVSGEPAFSPVATTDIRQSVEWLHAERVFLVNLVGDLHDAGLWDGGWRLAHLLAPSSNGSASCTTGGGSAKPVSKPPAARAAPAASP
ncbi:hypothetical protein ACFV0L_35775 [Streptosporangium canum]|uniref:hypothetical protein n=1 Tax=Streptosporangium canum TaxID=324952 RepID=UPI00367ABFE2